MYRLYREFTIAPVQHLQQNKNKNQKSMRYLIITKQFPEKFKSRTIFTMSEFRIKNSFFW